MQVKAEKPIPMMRWPAKGEADTQDLWCFDCWCSAEAFDGCWKAHSVTDTRGLLKRILTQLARFAVHQLDDLVDQTVQDAMLSAVESALKILNGTPVTSDVTLGEARRCRLSVPDCPSGSLLRLALALLAASGLFDESEPVAFLGTQGSQQGSQCQCQCQPTSDAVTIKVEPAGSEEFAGLHEPAHEPEQPAEEAIRTPPGIQVKREPAPRCLVVSSGQFLDNKCPASDSVTAKLEPARSEDSIRVPPPDPRSCSVGWCVVEWCGQEFSSWNSYQQHVKAHHRDIWDLPEGRGWHCDICLRWLPANKLQANHVYTHVMCPRPCDNCDASFIASPHLATHLKRYHRFKVDKPGYRRFKGYKRFHF